MGLSRKKIFAWPLLLTGLTVVSTTVSSCGIFNFFNNLATPKEPENIGPTIQNLSAFLPTNDYKKIYDLSFSFEFNNSGGYNPSRSMSPNEGVTPDNVNRPYRVFGTGWLFDWQDHPVDEDDPSAKWTGYFATNLHVAEALLNPLDNEHYRPAWYKNELPLPGVDRTVYFNLGKWDEDLAIKNRHNPKALTYLPLSNLPKTVYAATSFYKEAPKWITPIAMDNPGIREYIDFAVLAITLDLSWTYRNGQKVYRYNDEFQLYKRWIIPAMNIATSLWNNKGLYNQPVTPPNKKEEDDPTTDELPHLGFFDRSDYANPNVSLNNFSVYLGGYPYYSNWPATPQYTKFSVPSLIRRQVPITSDSRGSPGWTINALNPGQVDGQKIATSTTLSSSGGIRSGIYNADIARNFQLVYRNVKYKQYGYGYIIQNSNLSAGSSGSLALTSNNQALGIYFGTVSVDATDEATFGLVASLFNPTQINVNVVTGNNVFETDTIEPYDLIYGNDLMTDDYGSYVRALQSIGLSSRLLTQLKENLANKPTLSDKDNQQADKVNKSSDSNKKDEKDKDTKRNPLAALLSDIFNRLPTFN
ncbi:DUF31 family protein [Mycoplasma tullyi]|uniref:DUF31 family protein n=1 Tax=Mycoplasma tullyi TaxID=1612150 RepID=A0A7D7UBJ5_9MOLU|nr:DUF31 family protein [Mycoplasma tullyi]QMT98767.1 DUF31 family protein [Mycoplasma tullyi]